MNFKQKLEEIVKKNNSLLCVGLDTDIEKISNHLKNEPEPLLTFNKAIIDSTYDLVCCYKINSAFYEAEGASGFTQLKETIAYLRQQHPEIPVILDAKRSDIGNTAEMYAKSAFEFLEADAITINPYLGSDSIQPFLNYKDKGIIVVCRSSNPNASDFQNLEIDGEPLFIKVAKKVVEWNKYNNCLMVVGPTGNDLKRIREIAPDMFFLVPGIGAQGGDLKTTLQQGLTKEKFGLIINSSRSIIYASTDETFAQKAKEAAEKLKDQINSFRN